MIDKVKESASVAVDRVQSGQSVMVGGFGSAGLPADLINALLAKGVTDLVIISNNAGFDRQGVSVLIAAGQVRKLICSYPLTKGATAFGDAYRAKTIELELVPQGTLAERIRCGGAGLGGFLSPITVGTPLSKGKRMIESEGRHYVLETPLRADLAFVRARSADRIGNLTFHMSGRNFNPVMATAADHVIAEVDEIVAPGAIDPESVVTPGIFIDALIRSEGRQAA